MFYANKVFVLYCIVLFYDFTDHATLSKHEKSDTIGMLEAGLRVTGVARYYNCHPSTIQVLRDRWQAILFVLKTSKESKLYLPT